MNSKGNRIYGRAQRIEFFEKVAYVVIAILAIILIFVIIKNQKKPVDDNIDFAYLRSYLEANGYACDMIHQNGGSCFLRSDSSTSTFIRYESGFEFVINTDAYTLDIKHIEQEKDFTFYTTTNALAGYKSRNFICNTKGTVIDEFDKCVDEDGKVLDSNAYIGVIERAIKDINNFIDSSGYDKEILIKENKWKKK